MSRLGDILAAPDWEKVILVETKVGVEVEGFAWTATGGGSYYAVLNPSDYGEIVKVEENGVAYTKTASPSDCDSTPSSFYYDYSAGRLYIHTSGGDAPDVQVAGEYKYTIIAKFWACFTNRQDEDYRVIFTPPGASFPVFYHPFLSARSLPVITQAVGDYYLGNITLNFGSLRFINAGWFYPRMESWLWQNAKVIIKAGAKGFAYDNFETIFQGILRNPEIDDSGVVFEVKDERISKLKTIPVYKFWKSDYPNLEDEAEGRPIPIPYGELYNLTPICIDTTAHKYKISSYPIESVMNVYVDGQAVSFTADTANGEFTLSADPGDGHVTCDIKGIKCDMTTGAFSENIADILYHILSVVNGLSNIDETSFSDLKAARTQKIAWLIDSEITTLDFIRLLEASGVFHLLINAEGKYEVKYYQYGAGTAITVNQEDIKALSIKYDSNRIFKRVVVKYGRNFTTGEWKRVEAKDERVAYRFKDEDTLIVETALRDSTEAQSLASFYLKLVKRFGKFIEGEFSSTLLTAQPADKIAISKAIVDDGGEKISVLEAEVYRVLSLQKNFATGTVRVTALRDIEATGAEHADIAHEDSHGDVPHSDVVHSDASHVDSHGDSHGDTHSDVVHSDTAHADGHSDFYSDYADDPLHTDKYTDTHSDAAHSDVPHSDSHSDSYTDTYSDAAHSDVAHEDIAHEDSHGDVPHSDSEY